MEKWEKNPWVIEAKQNIVDAEKSYAEAEELFNKYAEQIKNIDEALFGWLESGYGLDQHYNQMDIENSKETISEARYLYNVRSAGAKKAAATRKANKLKLA